VTDAHRPSPAWHAFLLAVLALALYWPSLTGGPVFDDYNLLQYHPRYLTMTVHTAFTTDFWHMDPPLWRAMHYRPLALLAYAGIYRLFGMEPVAFHAVNMLLHAAAVVAFFLLLEGLGFPRRVGVIAGCLFAVDPLHVEAVSWITGMMETLMAALSLASLACFVYKRRVASVLLAGAAMLVKETALILPVLIFLIEWYRVSGDSDATPPPQPAWRAAERSALPYLPFVAICLGARGIILPRMPEDLQAQFFAGIPVMARVAAAYLRLLFWPWPLAISYATVGIMGILAAAGFVLASAVITMRLYRTHGKLGRDLLLGSALTLLPLAAPVAASPLMQKWLQVQDRYAYFASAGACLLVALIVASLQTARLRKVGRVVAMLLVAAGAWGTWTQEQVWADSEAMWRHTLQVTPDAPFVSFSLAKDLARDGRFQDAAQVLEDALRKHPRSTTLMNLLVNARLLDRMASAIRGTKRWR
jgi:hypothetical protein